MSIETVSLVIERVVPFEGITDPATFDAEIVRRLRDKTTVD